MSDETRHRPVRHDEDLSKLNNVERRLRHQEARHLMHTVHPPYIHHPDTPGLIRKPTKERSE